MSELSTVVWDGDNTLWDWMGYAVPAYEAMCEEIARIAGTDFKTTAAAMKAYYSSKGTLEDTRLIQGLEAAGFFSQVQNFDGETTITRVHGIFSRVRRANLHLYDGIEEPLRHIRERGMRQVLLTDAPLPQARARIRHANLHVFFDEIHAMPGVPTQDLPAQFRSSLQERKDEPTGHVVPEEKPHSDLEAVLKMTREQIARHVVIIGDNNSKDMALARQYECSGIHAEYGAAHPDQILRIQQFAPPRVARRNMQVQQEPGSVSPKKPDRIRVANNPTEIIYLLSNDTLHE